MVSTPSTSSAPDGPTQSSPLRSGGQFRTWFTNITEWIKGLSPAGQPYSTNWYVGPSKTDQVLALEDTWDVTAFACSREGRDVDMQINLTYQGPEISVPSHGDIVNVPIGQLNDNFAPRYMGSLTSGHTGPMATAVVYGSGSMTLCAVSPGTTITAGRVFTFQGMWRIAGTDRP